MISLCVNKRLNDMKNDAEKGNTSNQIMKFELKLDKRI